MGTCSGGIKGGCLLARQDPDRKRSHFIGFGFSENEGGRVHATFSILDKHDKALRKVFEMGTATAPEALDFNPDTWGAYFTPTAEEKAQSVRAEWSTRLRAEARVFRVFRVRRGNTGPRRQVVR